VGLWIDVALSDLAQSAGRLIGRLSLLELLGARRSGLIVSVLVLEIGGQENATSFFFQLQPLRSHGRFLSSLRFTLHNTLIPSREWQTSTPYTLISLVIR
jgi:hypothetical protein